MIGVFPLFRREFCSLNCPLLHRSPVVVLLTTVAFNSTFFIDVIRVKPYVDSFLEYQ